MILIAITTLALALQAASLPAAASSAQNDYNPSLDGRLEFMVFARSAADFRGAKIHVVTRNEEGWGKPSQISFSDERYDDSDPWLTADGKTLYFISNRPAEGRAADRKDYDIWRAHLVAGRWAQPEHLGPEINSTAQELGPEVHGGAIYFSSARRSGVGGLDIYQAEAMGEDFAQARLLDGPFNSTESESDFTLSADGTAAMFWRMVGERGIIHIAYRLNGEWSLPDPLPSSINVANFNFTPAFSPDGKRIWYASTLPRDDQEAGLADIFEASLPSPPVN